MLIAAGRGGPARGECQTEGITNLGATEKSEEVEVTCDYCQRVVVVAPDGEDA